MAATSCFFFWSARSDLACFWDACFFAAFGDLSPMVTAPFVWLFPPAHHTRIVALNYKPICVAGDPTLILANPPRYGYCPVVDPATGAAAVLPHVYPDGSSGCKNLVVSGRFGLVTWRDEDYFRFNLPPAGK